MRWERSHRFDPRAARIADRHYNRQKVGSPQFAPPIPGGDYGHEMTEDDHRSLAELLHNVAGFVVLSGYPSDLYDRELYPGWERHERQHIANGGRKRTEVVWLNPACSEALERERAQLELVGHR